MAKQKKTKRKPVQKKRSARKTTTRKKTTRKNTKSKGGWSARCRGTDLQCIKAILKKSYGFGKKKKRFKSVQALNAAAGEIEEIIKKGGHPVTVRVVKNILRGIKKVEPDWTKPVPVMPPDYDKPMIYFYVCPGYDWYTMVGLFDARVHIKSPMIWGEKFVFKAGNKIESASDFYADHFSDFVKFCNENKDAEDDSTTIPFYVRHTALEKNKEKKRWEVELIICDSNGELLDIGFRPGLEADEQEFKEPPAKPKEPTKKEKPEKPVEKPEKPSARERELELELQIEKAKTERVKELSKLILELKELGYTKKEIKEMLPK